MLCSASALVGSLQSTSVYAQDESTRTTTFLVVRHAERDGNLDKLTKAGEERAQALSAVGGALRVQVIYSTDTERTKGTVKPLATTVDTRIQIYRTPSEAWISSLKENHLGQVVLIVGHSNTAGVIAGLLADEEPVKLAHDEYDALFVIQVSKSETRSVRLRYGSAAEGASSADPDKMGELNSARDTR